MRGQHSVEIGRIDCLAIERCANYIYTMGSLWQKDASTLTHSAAATPTHRSKPHVLVDRVSEGVYLGRFTSAALQGKVKVSTMPSANYRRANNEAASFLPSSYPSRRNARSPRFG